MLCLGRRPDESVTINGNIVVEVLKIGQGHVRIGIKAPADVVIVRTELLPLFPAKVEPIDIGSRNVSASLNEAYPCHLHGCQDCGSCQRKAGE